MSAVPIARRPGIAFAILLVGGIVYACLSMPAIARRGFPPIDPWWLGVTHLWLAPVLLSSLFDSNAFRTRRHALAIYALITAYIHAGTATSVIPRRVDPFEMLLLTIIFYGPIHLLGTFGGEWLMQRILRRMRTLVDHATPNTVPGMNLASWLVAFTLICLTIGFPFMYRSVAIQWNRARGGSLAAEEWTSGDACVLREYDHSYFGDIGIEYEVDRDTGLPRHHSRPDFGFRDGYNAKIAELIERHGLPPWSLKEHIPTAKELATWLDSTELTEVTSFPHELTPSIVLMRRGSMTRWGSTTTSSNASLSIETPKVSMGVGDGVQPVHFGIEGALVVIRNGKDWVGVFHRDGRLIASASR